MAITLGNVRLTQILSLRYFLQMISWILIGVIKMKFIVCKRHCRVLALLLWMFHGFTTSRCYSDFRWKFYLTVRSSPLRSTYYLIFFSWKDSQIYFEVIYCNERYHLWHLNLPLALDLSNYFAFCKFFRYYKILVPWFLVR